jgi:hypothetical protein
MPLWVALRANQSCGPVGPGATKPKRRQEDAALQGAAFGCAGALATIADAVYSNVNSPHVAG